MKMNKFKFFHGSEDKNRLFTFEELCNLIRDIDTIERFRHNWNEILGNYRGLQQNTQTTNYETNRRQLP